MIVFQQLFLPLQEVFLESKQQEKVQFAFDIIYKNGIPNSLKDKLCVHVELNWIDNSTPLSKGSKVRLVGGEYFAPVLHKITTELRAGQSYKFIAEFEATANSNLENFPEQIFCSVYKNNSTTPISSNCCGFKLPFHHFIADILSLREKSRILIFGIVGSGKTTLMNKITSCLVDVQNELSVGATNNSSKHVTTAIQVPDLNAYFPDKFRNIGFDFIDTPGLTASTYTTQKFAEILNGNFQINVLDQNNSTPPIALKNNNNNNNNFQNKVHTIMFVAKHSLVEDNNLALMLRTYIQQAIVQHQLNPILVVTHCDEIPRNMHTEIVKRFKSATGLSYTQIFTVSNDPRVVQRTYENDRDLLLILMNSLKNSFASRNQNSFNHHHHHQNNHNNQFSTSPPTQPIDTTTTTTTTATTNQHPSGVVGEFTPSGGPNTPSSVRPPSYQSIPQSPTPIQPTSPQTFTPSSCYSPQSFTPTQPTSPQTFTPSSCYSPQSFTPTQFTSPQRSTPQSWSSEVPNSPISTYNVAPTSYNNNSSNNNYYQSNYSPYQTPTHANQSSYQTVHSSSQDNQNSLQQLINAGAPEGAAKYLLQKYNNNISKALEEWSKQSKLH